MASLKICRECTWYRPNNAYSTQKYRMERGHCMHPQFKDIHRITGEVSYPEAIKLREDDASAGRCGAEGVLWEREQPHKIWIREQERPYSLEFTFFALCCLYAVLFELQRSQA